MESESILPRMPGAFLHAARALSLAAAACILGLVSCRPRYAPGEPIDLASNACCKVGNKELTHFAGCRATDRCKSEEALWMRGAVTCGPVDTKNCVGGRCCHYRPLYGTEDAVLNWEGAPAEDEQEDVTPDGTATGG